MSWKTLEANPKTWKWVFFVCLSIFVVMNFSSFPRVRLDLTVVVFGMSLIALYGLAYERPLWSRRFWRAFFWVFFAGGIFMALFMTVTVVDNTDQLGGGLIYGPALWFGNAFFVVLILSFYAVQMRGIYLYSYKRNHLWTENQGKAGQDPG